MLRGLLGALGVVAACIGAAGACGGPKSEFADAPDVVDPPEADPRDAEPLFLPDAVTDGATCRNLECRQAACGSTPTSVSGTVYDPSGTTPLYDVAVYVPNAPLAPIPDGVDLGRCESCSAPLSGSPLAITLTDSHGHFKLENVPSGANVPLVIQTGKFRREDVVIPNVVPCADNPIADPLHQLLRLPKNHKEGHLPLIAIATGGCEGLECVLRTFGFDDAEFTAASGKGRFNLYSGHGGGGAVGSSDAYTFWGSNAVFKYDMIVNSCECFPAARDASGPAYANMKKYLDHGGRLFTSDYQYNWFTDPQAPAEFTKTAEWLVPQKAPKYPAPWFIDTSLPKGKALDEWLQFVFKTSPPPQGEIALTTLLFNVGAVHPGTTRWIYATADGQPHLEDKSFTSYATKYLSFNTPQSSDPDAGATQCGRAVFADLHVSHNIHTTTWPLGCNALAKDQQTTAFEFLFFDLSSCVQDDLTPPQPPPPY